MNNLKLLNIALPPFGPFEWYQVRGAKREAYVFRGNNVYLYRVERLLEEWRAKKYPNRMGDDTPDDVWHKAETILLALHQLVGQDVQDAAIRLQQLVSRQQKIALAIAQTSWVIPEG